MSTLDSFKTLYFLFTLFRTSVQPLNLLFSELIDLKGRVVLCSLIPLDATRARAAAGTLSVSPMCMEAQALGHLVLLSWAH